MTSPLRGPADSLAPQSKQTEPGRDPSGFRSWWPFPVSAHLPIVGGFEGLVEGSVSIHAFQRKNWMPAGRCFLFLLCSKRLCRNVAVSRARAPPRSRTPARSITHSDAVGYGLGRQEQVWCGERGTRILCLHSLSLNLGLKSLMHTQDLERRHLLAHWPHKPVCLSAAGGTLEGLDDTGLCVRVLWRHI